MFVDVLCTWPNKKKLEQYHSIYKFTIYMYTELRLVTLHCVNGFIMKTRQTKYNLRLGGEMSLFIPQLTMNLGFNKR